MNNSIRTYDDLLAYQQQLKELLALQKQVIHYDIKELKDELSPLTNVVRVASKFFTRNKDHSALVNASGSLVDLVLKKVVLPRSGWITRMVVPFLAKNISSHLVADHKEGLLSKVISIIDHKKKKNK